MIFSSCLFNVLVSAKQSLLAIIYNLFSWSWRSICCYRSGQKRFAPLHCVALPTSVHLGLSSGACVSTTIEAILAPTRHVWQCRICLCDGKYVRLIQMLYFTAASICPSRKSDISNLVLRALFTGTCVSLMNACIAGKRVLRLLYVTMCFDQKTKSLFVAQVWLTKCVPTQHWWDNHLNLRYKLL